MAMNSKFHDPPNKRLSIQKLNEWVAIQTQLIRHKKRGLDYAWVGAYFTRLIINDTSNYYTEL